jgi:glycosyltransferase involved in cell wall biosynthesis
MRVLAIHNQYQIRGGEDSSRDSKLRLLIAQGHTVRELTFDNAAITRQNAILAGLRASWNQAAYQGLKRSLSAWKPDIVDVDNFFPLASPSIYYAARECGVPVVQTLQNYRLLCPGGTLFRNGRVCELCVGKPMPWQAVAHACYRNSRAASLAATTMLTIHNVWGTWAKQVTLFVTGTESCRSKFIAGGLPGDRILVKPNFLSPDPGKGSGDDDYVLFAGRLTEEKGIRPLLDAGRRLTTGTLLIAGEGTLRPVVQEAAGKWPHIRYLGPRSAAEIQELMGRAKALVFPSIWFEGFPMAIVEAFSRGTPVIASRLGSMAEIVQAGKNGWLIEPGNPDQLADAIGHVFGDDPISAARLRASTRTDFEEHYTAERNYERLMLTYEKAIQLGGPHTHTHTQAAATG